MFTYNDLKDLTKAELLSIVDFYDLDEISKYSRKDVILDHILEQFNVDKDDEYKEEQPMSVRVRRLKELNK